MKTRIKKRTDATKLTNVRIARFRQCKDLIWESKVFIEYESEVASRVSSVERRVIYFRKLLIFSQGCIYGQHFQGILYLFWLSPVLIPRPSSMPRPLTDLNLEPNPNANLKSSTLTVILTLILPQYARSRSGKWPSRPWPVPSLAKATK